MCTYHASAFFIPGHFFTQHRNDAGQVYQCAKFGVDGSKIPLAQHVQCTPQVNFLYSDVMPLPCCTSVPILVLLAKKKITGSEDPTFIKFHFFSTYCLSHSAPVTTMACAHP